MLVSAEDLNLHMNSPEWSFEQETKAESVLSGVQSHLELYCNRLFEPTQISELLRSDLLGILGTSYSPVWKIVKLEPLDSVGLVDIYNFMTPYVPSPMERDPYVGRSTPMVQGIKATIGWPTTIVPGGISVGVPSTYYVVEYVSAYIGPHIQSVKEAILRVAARTFAVNADDTFSLSGDQASQAAKADSRELGWTDAELAQFDRLRRRNCV